jgi:hypothetical protein
MNARMRDNLIGLIILLITISCFFFTLFKEL